jgi:YD repeat-containing protein
LLTKTTYVAVGDARVIEYVYDEPCRLTGADYSSGERFEYTYDAVGNRTVCTPTVEGTQVTTYTYDAANRLTQIVEDGTPRTLTWSDLG